MQAFPKLGRAVVVAAALMLPSVALAEPPTGGNHPAEAAKPKHAASKSKDKKEHKEGDAAKKHEGAPKPEAN